MRRVGHAYRMLTHLERNRTLCVEHLKASLRSCPTSRLVEHLALGLPEAKFPMPQVRLRFGLMPLCELEGGVELFSFVRMFDSGFSAHINDNENDVLMRFLSSRRIHIFSKHILCLLALTY